MTINVDDYLTQTHFGDLESIGFYDVIHSVEDIHCLCTITEDDQVILWHDKPELDNVVVWDKYDEKEYTVPPRMGSLLDGFRYWYKIGKAGGKLSVHNCATYDKPVLEKVMPKCIIPDECWRDTFIQSKIQWFDRPQPKGSKSPHGLMAYGIRAGVNKPEIKDFTRFDGEILMRIVEDCRIQKFTQEYLDEEAVKLKKIGVDVTDAYKIEFEYAMNCAKQEVRGALADRKHMEACVRDWDIVTDALAEEIEPLLPPTVKPSGAKITRSELMESLGYDKKRIPQDELHEVTRAGETKWQPVKPYHKPSVKYFKVEKVNQYSGFDLSHGETPTYTKKKDLTDWIKENHPDTKTKDWDIQKEVKEGKVLNAKTCEYFGVQPEDTDIICGSHTRVSFTKSKLTQHEVVKGYLIRYAGLKGVEEWNLKKDSNGQIVRAEEAMVVSYPPKAHPDHQLHYKIKKGQPVMTSPKLQEKDYGQLVGDIGQKIGEYNTTVHRRRFISNPKDPENKGLLSYLREDNRLPCGVGNFQTASGRAAHRVWVNAAGASSHLGEEIRSIIIAPEGRRLVSADMKSAQLAILSFYAKNIDYYDAVASGQEVVKDEEGKEIYVGMSAHCHSARNFGMVSEEEFEVAVRLQDPVLLHSIAVRRGFSKRASFGVVFGCSGAKLAGMLDIPESEGEEKKNSFFTKMGLQGVIDWGKRFMKVTKRGGGFYIPLPFGYWVYCNSPHKIINYLCQGCEAACQKIAVNYFEREVVKRGLDAIKIMDYHDEYTVESSPEDAQAVGELLSESYKKASDDCFQWYMENEHLFPNEGNAVFAFDLDGGFKMSDIGNKGTYLQTH